MIQRILEAVQGRSLSVALPEGGDQRIIAAARKLKDDGLAEPIVLGGPGEVEAAAAKAGISLDDIALIAPTESDNLAAYAAAYAQRRRLDVNVARRIVKRPLYYAGMMVARGDAQAMVAGVTHATAMVIGAGALTVGLAEGVDTPSSFFLMTFPPQPGRDGRALVYADCGVNIAPTSAQLADIAIASQRSARLLLDEEPRVAMLSFSTAGSASHARVSHVTDALAIAREKAPGIKIDGEFQADAALVASVAAKKVSDAGDVAGRANVLIFPDLDSGNIAYKLTEHLAGAEAIGPILQGFAKPISDLSRGAGAGDVVDAAVICLAQALDAAGG